MGDDKPSKQTERIWRELNDRLRRFILSRVRCSSDADDILQLVFLKIHQKIASLRSDQRLDSWVFQITRNAIVDHYRKSVSDNNQQADTNLHPENRSAPKDTCNANAEVSRCLVALIEQLPADQKQAVSMYELDGLSQAAIAEQESISLSAAKSRVQRGRRGLKTMLLECCQLQLDTRGNVVDYQRHEDGCQTNCHCDESCD